MPGGVPEPLPFERPLGATTGGIRVWAPKARQVAVRLGKDDYPLESEGLGVWIGAPPLAHGDDYWIVLDGKRLPDPCTRFQPKGVRGPSRVVDPDAWKWTDRRWKGVALRDLVLLEVHVGTFTPQGTFDAATEHLGRLRAIGITGIELLPVAAFPGERGWGYDAVYPWSAQSAYGGPDGLQRLVDAAHSVGIAVILDVVPTTSARRESGRCARSARTSPGATRRHGARRSTTTTPIPAPCANG